MDTTGFSIIDWIANGLLNNSMDTAIITTTYDSILYPGQPLAQAHPDRLEVLSVLHNVGKLNIATSRILELGCGDGTNLISIAQSLPDAMCIGIDLAAAVYEEEDYPGYLPRVDHGNAGFVSHPCYN